MKPRTYDPATPPTPSDHRARAITTPTPNPQHAIPPFLKKCLVSRAFDGVEVSGLCGRDVEGVGMWAR